MSKAAGSRISSQIQDLKKALDKAIKNNDSAEAVMDILVAIEILPMTPELIKDSHLGKILVAVRTKFATEGTEVSSKAKDLLIEWKKIIEAQIKKEKDGKIEKIEKTEKSEKSEKSVSDIVSPPKQIENDNVLHLKKATTPAFSGGLNINETIKSEMQSFPEARKKVINLFIGHLKVNTTDLSKAENIAFSVDKAVDRVHSFDLDNKGYMGLVRSLAFNLKRNESLRMDLISGDLKPKLLVTLSPEDLATDEIRKARQSLALEDRESRRTDWLEEHKDKIQEKLELDPSNVWTYEQEVESDAE
mmetsp:Transcript_2785/g.2918  ORF Transcript_2785/g.2918 Transcript_2785/m.2918 type:complete len:303 (+) Transcript_2785:252-1160(+)|eukprot:CAMPEP_0119051492 /NCGR_PEP_ID=MMETSP1177-20130426/73086_1 /TAXON_ID=2985 /ORGANISM="Ochromonas sp, Strain CCMP1899" /LENGTH=302 /DNA_ID=CAMNT_0007030705 /DNA_START=251 /DNA_END=1159 /DNA_ORIENTATION=-